MNNSRVRFIRSLVINQDKNTLATIKREKGEFRFNKMSGVAIYRWAKKLWKKFGIKDKWGQTV